MIAHLVYHTVKKSVNSDLQPVEVNATEFTQAKIDPMFN